MILKLVNKTKVRFCSAFRAGPVVIYNGIVYLCFVTSRFREYVETTVPYESTNSRQTKPIKHVPGIVS